MKEDYPIFKKYYTTLDWILNTCEKYPKNVRFTFSSRIMNHSMDILELIIEAIYSPKNLRNEKLQKINLHLEKLRVFFRLSHSRNYITVKQYAFISGEVEEIGKMVGGWMKL